MIFDRFFSPKYSTELSTVLVCAEALARSYEHDYIGVEHVFLSLRQLPVDHPVSKVLANLPVDVGAFWQDLEKEARVVTGRKVPKVLPYTPRLNYVLDAARRRSKSRKLREVSLYFFVASVALEHTSLVAQVFYRQFHRSGKVPSFESAAAHFWATLIAFPDILKFSATGETNKNIAVNFRSK